MRDGDLASDFVAQHGVEVGKRGSRNGAEPLMPPGLSPVQVGSLAVGKFVDVLEIPTSRQKPLHE